MFPLFDTNPALESEAATQFYNLLTLGTSQITLAEMKSYLRVTNTVDDSLITNMIATATNWGENYTGRSFNVEDYSLAIYNFTSIIEIRRSPVDAVTSIDYIDTDGNAQVVSTDVYYVKRQRQWSYIILKDGQEWPTDVRDQIDSIDIKFSTTTMQPNLQNLANEAVIRTVAYWYRNRGDCSNCNCAAINAGVTGIYDQFRIVRI